MFYIVLISIFMAYFSLKSSELYLTVFSSENIFNFYDQTLSYKVYLVIVCLLSTGFFVFSENIVSTFFYSGLNAYAYKIELNLIIVFLVCLIYSMFSSFFISKKNRSFKQSFKLSLFGWVPIASIFHRWLNIEEKNIHFAFSFAVIVFMITISLFVRLKNRT
jgi:hypothetical protein